MHKVSSLIKASEVGSHTVYPLASKVSLIPPDGNDDASDSPLRRVLPESSKMGSPSLSLSRNESCFSAVEPVIGWNQCV